MLAELTVNSFKGVPREWFFMKIKSHPIALGTYHLDTVSAYTDWLELTAYLVEIAIEYAFFGQKSSFGAIF